MVERVRFILNLYSLWISNHHQQRHRELNHGISLREMVDERLSESYDYIRFLTDYRRITGIKRDFVGEDETACDVESCAVIGRNERNRGFYGKNESMRNQLYFIENGQSMDDDAVAKDIATQQILDSLHSYFYHSVHLNDDERKEIDDHYKGMKDDIDCDTLCDDYSAEKLINSLESKRNRSPRFRPKESVNRDSRKFVRTNEFEPTSNSFFNAVYENKRQRTFRDVFVSEMNQNQICDDAIRSFLNLLNRHQFDSDAIEQDFEYFVDSNLIQSMGATPDFTAIHGIAKRLILNKKLKLSSYSPGIRYFYWEKYRNNEQEKRLVFEQWRPIYEENKGYTLGHWFVRKKYKNLKHELLHNMVLTLSRGQFETTLQKARDKLNEWRTSGIQLRCHKHWWKDSYDIVQGQEISEEHIIAVLLYTNFPQLCYVFSATYRKTHEYEEDEDMLARHEEYGNWARLLREAVECFGTSMRHSNIRTFFHGVSDTLVFHSTSIQLCRPVSTTSSMLLVSFMTYLLTN